MERISPEHLAVLVVDVQVGLFRTKPPPLDGNAVISRINEVTAKAREAGVPVIFVQHDGPPDGDWMVPQSEDWQLHPGLIRTPEDLAIRKTMGDAFYRTGLEELLRSRDTQAILLMGYATDFCIDATLRQAVSKEFEVYVVADAHTTNDAPKLQAQQIRDHFNFVWSDTPSTGGIHVVNAREVWLERSPVRS